MRGPDANPRRNVVTPRVATVREQPYVAVMRLVPAV